MSASCGRAGTDGRAGSLTHTGASNASPRQSCQSSNRFPIAGQVPLQYLLSNEPARNDPFDRHEPLTCVNGRDRPLLRLDGKGQGVRTPQLHLEVTSQPGVGSRLGPAPAVAGRVDVLGVPAGYVQRNCVLRSTRRGRAALNLWAARTGSDASDERQCLAHKTTG